MKAIVESVVNVFGGVCGNIRVSCPKNLYIDGVLNSALLNYIDDKKSNFDPMIIVDEMMSESIHKHSNIYTNIVAQCLSPIQIASSCPNGRYSAIDFELSLAWYLSEVFFPKIDDVPAEICYELPHGVLILATIISCSEEDSSSDLRNQGGGEEPRIKYDELNSYSLPSEFVEAWNNLLSIGWFQTSKKAIARHFNRYIITSQHLICKERIRADEAKAVSTGAPLSADASKIL